MEFQIHTRIGNWWSENPFFLVNDVHFIYNSSNTRRCVRACMHANKGDFPVEIKSWLWILLNVKMNWPFAQKFHSLLPLNAPNTKISEIHFYETIKRRRKKASYLLNFEIDVYLLHEKWMWKYVDLNCERMWVCEWAREKLPIS